MKEKRKVSISTIILVIIFLAGLSLLLYPSVANWWNTRIFNAGISEYTSVMANADTSEMKQLVAKAHKYNKKISERGNIFYELSEEEQKEYDEQLNFDGSDMSMLGYLSIPKLRIDLPIYHGTSDAVLSAGIGHLPGTTLPIGGEGTHAVLSGHRGLPSARLLTDLDKLVEGDIFIVETFGMTLTYEVDQILIVLPEEVSALQIEKDKDLCTLVTCTPNGINTHRLLVRGHRIENPLGDIIVTSDALQIEPVMVAPFVAAPILFVLLIILLVTTRKKESMR